MKRTFAKMAGAVMALAMLLAACGGGPKLNALALPEGVAEVVVNVGESVSVNLQETFSADDVTEQQKVAAYAAAELQATSSDDGVVVAAIEDGDVTLTGVAPGTATVEISGKNNLSLTFAVAVADPVVPLTAIEVPETLFADLTGHGEEATEGEELAAEPAEDASAVADTEEEAPEPELAVIDVSLSPADATDITMVFASSDEDVVTVDDEGVLTPVAAGEAVVTTTVTGFDENRAPVIFTAETAVTVGIKATEIGLAATEGWLYVGGMYQLVPYTLPEDAVEHTYTYSSSDEAVATVDENGLVTAVANGTATILVTSETNPDLRLEYTLTVSANASRTSSGGTGSTVGGTTGGGGTGGVTSGSGGGGTTTPAPTPGTTPVTEPEPAPSPDEVGAEQLTPIEPGGDGGDIGWAGD